MAGALVPTAEDWAPLATLETFLELGGLALALGALYWLLAGI